MRPRGPPGLGRGRERVRGPPREHGRYPCGLCLHALAHLLPQSQTRPRGLCSLTPHLSACIYTDIYVCLYEDSNPLFFDHVQGYFPGNHHQAHLGHSLTPPPAAALSGPQSWRDPSHRAAQQGAGGAPRPSAGPRSTALHRGPWKRAPLLAASPSAPRPPQTCKPAYLARYQTRTFSSISGGVCVCVCPFGQMPAGSGPPELFAQVTRSSPQSLGSIVFTPPLKSL